jgi:vacuolar-type H+-ATPase subunit I/STV1
MKESFIILMQPLESSLGLIEIIFLLLIILVAYLIIRNNTKNKNKSPAVNQSASHKKISIEKVLYGKKYDTTSIFLNIIAAAMLFAAVLIPIFLISKIPDVLLKNNPVVLIVPIYFGLVLLNFSFICYMINEVLFRPSNANLWLESTLNVLGAIIIIVGLIGFFVVVSDTNSIIKELRNLGVIGGVVLLIAHGLLGMLSIGIASIHEKYNADSPELKKAIDSLLRENNESLFCSACGHVQKDKSSEFCEECGNKL